MSRSRDQPIVSCRISDPKWFQQLLRIDQELVKQTRIAGCVCGGRLHVANYPRKPRGCPRELRDDFSQRLSFCCARDLCRKRSTSTSVRFLGGRVYKLLAVVLLSARSLERMHCAAELATSLAVSRRTLLRWRQWWTQTFAQSALWRAESARFMPPLDVQQFPLSLLTAFGDPLASALDRLLLFLLPATVRLSVAV